MIMLRFCVILLMVLAIPPVTMAQESVSDFVEAEISNPRPFIGEQVVYTLRLYSNVQRAEQPGIVLPNFAGFWKREIDPIRQYPVMVGDRAFNVIERKIALFPAYVQSLAIGETAVVIRDDLSNFGNVLLTVPMTVEVQRLPETSDLEGFHGAVGRFEILPTLDRQQTRLGEPVTLNLTVRGTGNVEQLPAPQLPDTDSWRILENASHYQSFEFEGMLVGEKTFEWLLTPILAGDQAIPEITLRYFDPTSQTYQSISTTPITVNVSPADEPAGTNAIIVPAPERLPLKPVPATLHADGSISTIWFVPFWVVPPLAAALIWWEMRRRWHRQQHAQAYRRSEALRQALSVLKRDGNSVSRNGHDAMLGYFADKLNRPVSSLSYADIESALADHTHETTLAGRVVRYLETVDHMLYAPGHHAEDQQLRQQVAALLNEIDQQWRL